jgi:hypothetical protein
MTAPDPSVARIIGTAARRTHYAAHCRHGFQLACRNPAVMGIEYDGIDKRYCPFEMFNDELDCVQRFETWVYPDALEVVDLLTPNCSFEADAWGPHIVSHLLAAPQMAETSCVFPGCDHRGRPIEVADHLIDVHRIPLAGIVDGSGGRLSIFAGNTENFQAAAKIIQPTVTFEDGTQGVAPPPPKSEFGFDTKADR